MDDIKIKLIQADKDDNFFEVIREIYCQDKKGEKLLYSHLIDLHNKGQIDLVEICKNFKKTQKKQDFFAVRLVFEQVLPNLNASVIEVANCVKHLTLEAGKDRMAYMLLSPFSEFCQKSPDRIDELFDFALAKGNEDFDFLSTAIEAGANINEAKYVNLALVLLTEKNEIIKQRVIFALGRINYQDKSFLNSVFVAIDNSAALSPTDTILAFAMQALFSIMSQSEDLEQLFLDFLENNSENFDDHYIHTASGLIMSDNKKISSNVESILLKICCHTNPDNKGTIENIDRALERLLKRKDFDACVDFLECFFKLSEYKLSVKHFSLFVLELHKHRDTYLSTLITRWLLSKKVIFGEYCYDLLQNVNKGISIGFDESLISDKKQSEHLFLARKACGWFFSQPKTAISLIESLIPNASKEDLADFQKLILNPLCISYPGTIRPRLKELQEPSQNRVKEIATKVLSEYDNYQESVNAACKVNELKPSEQDRHSYGKYYSKLMGEAMKQAKKQPFLTLLGACNISILLYGNKSINYISHGEQKTREEAPLQKISQSIELASMCYLDPHGLDDIIWQFKAEGCTS